MHSRTKKAIIEKVIKLGYMSTVILEIEEAGSGYVVEFSFMGFEFYKRGFAVVKRDKSGKMEAWSGLASREAAREFATK